MIKDPHPDMGRALHRLEQEQGRTIEKGSPRGDAGPAPGAPPPSGDD